MVRSVQTGRIALRAGIVWGVIFAAGMFILALPALAAILTIAVWGWPAWLDSLRHENSRQFAEVASTLLMIVGGVLAWRSIRTLGLIEKKLRGEG